MLKELRGDTSHDPFPHNYKTCTTVFHYFHSILAKRSHALVSLHYPKITKQNFSKMAYLSTIFLVHLAIEQVTLLCTFSQILIHLHKQKKGPKIQLKHLPTCGRQGNLNTHVGLPRLWL